MSVFVLISMRRRERASMFTWKHPSCFHLSWLLPTLGMLHQTVCLFDSSWTKLLVATSVWSCITVWDNCRMYDCMSATKCIHTDVCLISMYLKFRAISLPIYLLSWLYGGWSASCITHTSCGLDNIDDHIKRTFSGHNRLNAYAFKFNYPHLCVWSTFRSKQLCFGGKASVCMKTQKRIRWLWQCWWKCCELSCNPHLQQISKHKHLFDCPPQRTFHDSLKWLNKLITVSEVPQDTSHTCCTKG